MITSIPGSELHETELTFIQKELGVVQLLFDISHILNKSLDLEKALEPILGKLAEYFGIRAGTITVLNRQTGAAEIDLLYGIPKEDRSKRKLYREIVDKILETGTPAILESAPQKSHSLREGSISRDPGQSTKDNILYISVPIHDSAGVIGVLGTDRLFHGETSVEEDVRLLGRIAILLGDAIELRNEARNQKRILQEKADRLQTELTDRFRLGNIIGNSHAILEIHQLIKQVSSSRSNVLITGETGAGKELVARAIHATGPRASKSFIKVDIAALPRSRIGSGLLGRDTSSFSRIMHNGCFDLSRGGTLFLDGIDFLPLEDQAGLLRVIKEQEPAPTGSDGPAETDVRIISAATPKLEELVQASQFRLDLFYRLNAFPIFMPPLRERKTDIILLADYFAERAGKKYSKHISRISTHSIDMMMNHLWPGNVRELENCIERAVLLSTDGVIHRYHLPPSLQMDPSEGTAIKCNLRASLAALEQDMIADALRSARGNVALAAHSLEVSELLIARRIRKYGIDPECFRTPNG